jgi:diamine N-acetyltransferase
VLDKRSIKDNFYTMINIRLATIADAANLAKLAKDTFTDAFGDVNDQQDLALFYQQVYGEAIQRAELENPNMTTYVAEHNQQLIAYAQLHVGKAPNCIKAQNPLELKRLYLNANYHGKGLAQKLMATCISQANEQHHDKLWLGVWENNPKAQSFYKKFQFKEVGKHCFMLGNDPQRDIIMLKTLME